jgi:hypothetical protein
MWGFVELKIQWEKMLRVENKHETFNSLQPQLTLGNPNLFVPGY